MKEIPNSMDHSAMDHATMVTSDDAGSTHSCGGSMSHGGHASSFHQTTEETILFNGLKVGPDVFSYMFACLFIVGLGVIRQEIVRHSEIETYSTEKRTALYFLQATISYLLMLVAMTFNIGLFLAVMTGLTFGYYRSLVHLKNKAECCA